MQLEQMSVKLRETEKKEEVGIDTACISCVSIDVVSYSHRKRKEQTDIDFIIKENKFSLVLSGPLV